MNRTKLGLALAALGLLVGFILRVAGSAPREAAAGRADPDDRQMESRARHLPPPRLAPEATRQVSAPTRSQDQWQGMRVDADVQPPCGRSAHCGLARACIDGRCVACRRDGDCEAGEFCVLEHCVQEPATGCRTRQECRGPDELCILSGYSSDPRGNAELRSFCNPGSGGSEETALEVVASDPEDEGKPATVSPVQHLLDDLRRERARGQTGPGQGRP